MARKDAKSQSAYQFHAMKKFIVDYLFSGGQFNSSTITIQQFMARKGAKAQSAYQFHAMKKIIID